MACAQACERGVHGKTGCMAAVDDKHPTRRTKMLTLACEAKEPGACRLAAEASITLGMSNPRQYQVLLERACDQRDRQACEKLGDYWLLESLPSAKAAYDRGCQLETARARACSEEVAERIASIDRERAACKQDQLAACERLLKLAAARNHDLGYHAAHTACRLRGLNEYYRGTELRHSYKLRKRFSSYEPCGLFSLARAAAGPGESTEFERVPLPDPTPTAGRAARGRVALTGVAFHFRNAPSVQPEQVVAFKAGVEAGIREHLALGTRCYQRHLAAHPEAGGNMDAVFIIDKLGEALELRCSGELTDPELCACLLSATIPERFTGLHTDLGSIARVEAKFELQPRPAGTP